MHAAGCSHYQNPAEGVLPKDMMRQIEGEKLNFGAVLTWGPDYYYQKQFFSGKDDPLSSATEKMHYDLEVSGFPSSHAGHLVLLGLKDQDYPHTQRIEDWPTWDLPILQWANSKVRSPDSPIPAGAYKFPTRTCRVTKCPVSMESGPMSTSWT